MYPYAIFLGLGLYEIFIVLGVVLCLVMFRIYADKLSLPVKIQNLCLIGGVLAVILGYLSGILFQAVYDWIDNGTLAINTSTGSTFYGGLIGGIAVFMAVYFGFGKLIFKDNSPSENFKKVSSIAVCSITLAHGFGRLGCLMAGCCYGIHSKSIFAIYFERLGEKVLPTQLYEAIFLFGLCVVLSVLLFKGKKLNLPIYFIAYGVWRFLIEFLRADDRGSTIVSFLTPSQFIALLLIGIGIFLIVRDIRKNNKDNESANYAK